MKKLDKFTTREMALLDAWSDYNQPTIDDVFEARVLDAVHEAAHSTCDLDCDVGLDLDMQLTEVGEVEATSMPTSQAYSSRPCAARNWTAGLWTTEASETTHADASGAMAHPRLASKPTILFVAANPTRTSPVALNEEAQAVESALERLGYGHCYNVETKWAAEPLDLLRALRKLNPAVVHYAGHGGMGQRSNVVVDRNESYGEPGGGLYFMAPNGDPEVISAQVLSDTFRAAGPDVRLVVLNACYSELHAEALRAHVSCVVGMPGTISDDIARSFAANFYCALGTPASVATAFQLACSATELEGLCESERPQLKARDDIDIAKLGLGFLVSYTQGANGIEARAWSAADRPNRVRGPDVGATTSRNMALVEAHVAAANHEARPADRPPTRTIFTQQRVPISATSNASAEPENAHPRSFRARRNHQKAQFAISATVGGGITILSVLSLLLGVGFATMGETVLIVVAGLLAAGSFGVLSLTRMGRIRWESRTDDSAASRRARGRPGARRRRA